MPLSDTAPALAGLVDQLVAAKQRPAVLRLYATTPELRDRARILQIADSVNRIAREDLAKAEDLAEAASHLADALEDDYCRARTGRAMGNVQVLRGHYPRALEIFQNALELFRTLGEELEEAATLSSSLQPLIYLGHYDEAFQKAREAQNIAERHHDELLLARLEINFGNIFHRQDRFSEAVQHYKRALLTLERLAQHRDCAVAAINMAVCYISLNDFRQAELAYQKARTVSEREGMPMLLAQADYNIAYLHYHRGEHNLAIHLYQQTRRYCEKVGDRYHGSLCDLDQAELYLELHLNREGSELAQQAFHSFEKMNMGYEAAKALVFLGIAAYQDRKSFRAVEILATAQERMSREQNLAWSAIISFYQALILEQEGRYYEALRHCKAAQSFYSKFPDSGKWALILSLRAALHLDIGEVEEAENWSRQAVACGEKLKSATLLTQAYWIRGRVDESRESSALKPYGWYSKSLQSLEAIPSRLRAEELKIPFRKNRLDLYESLVSLTLILSGPTNHAGVFELIEKAKSRDLAEQIAFRSNTATSSNKGRSVLAEQVKALREELNWYYRRIDDFDLQTSHNSITGRPQELRLAIRSREESLVKTLDELHVTDEEFHEIQTGSIVPLERIREVLSPDETIVEYYQARGFIYACVVGRDALHVEQITTVDRVRSLLQKLEGHFSNCRLGEDEIRRFSGALAESVITQLRAMHSELIETLSSYLTTKRLIIITDGFLNYLPFHAFFDGSQYLTERHVVSYAGSASAYFLAQRKLVAQYEHDLVLGSDAIFAGNANAAQRVGAVLPRSRALLDSQMSTKTLAQHGAGSRFIHIETRMESHPDNGVFSALFLGEDKMTVLDIFNLQLPCSLISLSGTGPGLRTSGKGEEINLFARGLLYAGAQSVLMPLWNVEGEPKAKFMETFYRIADREPDKALALQKATLEIRDQFPSPYHWAPYILRGATGHFH